MISAGIRDLKNNLSRYLRRVQSGERIAITDRGRVVAELRPPEDVSTRAADRYSALVASGLIRPPIVEGNLPADWPSGAVRLPAGTAAALIDEDRGD